MKLRTAIPIALALFLPDIAFANSMVPVFPILSAVGWLALPAIILIEGAFFSRKGVPHPLKLSLYSNLWSAFIGLLLAAATFPIMAGPAIEPYFEIIIVGTIVTVIGILFHWWLSSHLEHKFSKWHKLWKEEALPLQVFYKANAVTYSIIAMYLLFMMAKTLMEYKMKT